VIFKVSKFTIKLLILVSSFILPGFFLASAQAEPKAILEANVVQEDYKTASLISGNWIVGVHIDAEENTNNPSLYSRIPSGWGNSKFCARSTDVTGRYTALTEYAFKHKWGGGLAKLNYSKKYKSLVETMNLKNSGIAIHKGDCASISEIFVPALWNATEQPVKTKAGNIRLIINLNAQRSDQVFARGTVLDTTYTARCFPLPQGGIAFNFQCLLEIPPEISGTLNFEVWQVRSGVVAKPRSAEIILQASS